MFCGLGWRSLAPCLPWPLWRDPDAIVLPPETSEAVSQMRSCMETIKRREAHLRQQFDEKRSEAMALARTDRRSALLCVQSSKTIAAEMNKWSAARLQIEKQAFALEAGSLSAEMINTMRMATFGLRPLSKAMTPEGVAEAIQDADDAVQDVEEVGAALSRPGMDVLEGDSGAALEAELADLEADRVTSQLEDIRCEAEVAAPVPRKQRQPQQKKLTAHADADADAEVARLRQKMQQVALAV